MSLASSWRLVAVFIAGLGVVAVQSLLLATPVSASTSTYSDPRLCSATVNEGVCIAAMSAGDDGTTISLTMTVGHATDPESDPNWKSWNSGFNWDLYIDGASQAEFYARAGDYTVTSNEKEYLGPFLGEVAKRLMLPGLGGQPLQCDWTSGVVPSVNTTSNQLSISFPASCIGNPSSLSVAASWQYDTGGGKAPAGPGGAVLHASSPASGACCEVTASMTSTQPQGTLPSTSTSTSTPTPSPSPSPSQTSTTVSLPPATKVLASRGVSVRARHLALTGSDYATKWLAGLGAVGFVIGLAALLLVRRNKQHRPFGPPL